MKTDYIVQKFLNDFQTRNNVFIEGVLGFGSAFNKKYFQKHSDIDLFIITKENSKRYRGIKEIDQVEIDYFANSFDGFKKIWDKFKNDPSQQNNTIYNLLNDAIVIMDTDKKLEALISEAKNFNYGSPMDENEKIIAKYFIIDLLNDLKDYKKNSYEYCHTLNKILEKIIVFYRINCNLNDKKPKYLSNDLNDKFKKLYCESFNDFDKLTELVSYCFSKAGGEQKKEWEIISNTN